MIPRTNSQRIGTMPRSHVGCVGNVAAVCAVSSLTPIHNEPVRYSATLWVASVSCTHSRALRYFSRMQRHPQGHNKNAGYAFVSTSRDVNRRGIFG